jgi:TfoX/Sxy family transcriptional regulator of competence genes
LWSDSLHPVESKSGLDNDVASDLAFVEFVADQLDRACDVSYRKMFGEYALYSNGKVVALICDNQLFVKPTAAGRSFIDEVVEAPPYPGAKPAFLVQDRVEDRAWLTELIVRTEQTLPKPKPKRKKERKPRVSKTKRQG